MQSLFDYRSPLKDNPPPPGMETGSPVSNRVVIVLVDALRLDTSLDAEVMPFLNELRSQAAVARMNSRPPSYSQPGYTVILTGAWPEISDGPPINLGYDEIPVFTQDDLFSAVHDAGLSTAVSGYYWFEKLIPQAGVEHSFYTPGEDHAADLEVVRAAIPWLESGGDGLVLIHIDQVDFAGHHEGGPQDERWNQAARRADELIREISQAVDLSRDTLLIISDHGQVNRGGHGGNEKITLIEPFVLLGAGVIPGDYGEVDMVDVAPTVAVLLGSRIPASSQGMPLLDALAMSDEQKDKILQINETQQTQLLENYRAVTDPGGIIEEKPGDPPLVRIETLRGSLVNRERLLRLVPALLLASLPAVWFLTRRDRDSAWLLLGSVLILAVFHGRYALIDHKTYSLSSVNSVDDLFAYIAMGMALGLAGALFILVFGVQLHRRKPVAIFETILNLTLTTIYILLIPALWSFYLNGLQVTWALPEFTSSFLGFLSLLQVIFISALGLLAAGIGMLTGWLAGIFSGRSDLSGNAGWQENHP